MNLGMIFIIYTNYLYYLDFDLKFSVSSLKYFNASLVLSNPIFKIIITIIDIKIIYKYRFLFAYENNNIQLKKNLQNCR